MSRAKGNMWPFSITCFITSTKNPIPPLGRSNLYCPSEAFDIEVLLCRVALDMLVCGSTRLENSRSLLSPTNALYNE